VAVTTGMFTNNRAILLDRALQRHSASFFYADAIYCAIEQKHIDEYQRSIKFIYAGETKVDWYDTQPIKKQAINLLDELLLVLYQFFYALPCFFTWPGEDVQRSSW
jgi:hypothetical protein